MCVVAAAASAGLFSCHSPKRKATLDTLVESDRNFIGAHLRALLALKYKLAAATRLHLHLSARGSGFRLFYALRCAVFLREVHGGC